jgi:hypothetical protein
MSKTIYLVVELSIDEDVDPTDIADDLFNHLVDAEDLPPVIFSVDGVNVRGSEPY